MLSLIVAVALNATPHAPPRAPPRDLTLQTDAGLAQTFARLRVEVPNPAVPRQGRTPRPPAR